MSPDLESFVAAKWGMASATVEHFTSRENEIYCAKWKGQKYAVKVARKGHLSLSQLDSELQFLSYLTENGMNVLHPLASFLGNWHELFEGRYVSISRWLDGFPMSDLNIEDDQDQLYFELGSSLATLHNLADLWVLPSGFERPSWGREGLVGENPFWGEFWQHPKLDCEEQAVFQQFRDDAMAELGQMDLDFGLIHADAVRENVFVDQGKITLIDFDDFGFGYRLFDLATVLLKVDHVATFSELRDALIAGYLSKRDLDLSQLPLIMALRAVTYLGWIKQRSELDADGKRAHRFKTHALKYIQQWREQ